MTSTPASMGGPLSDADRLAEIQARLDAATEGPWEQGATLLLGEVMFTDDLRETTSDRATKCCYCTKCGPVLWEGMTELFERTVKAHRHRSPTTPAAFADDMVMGANARIITSEVHKPADTALIANAPSDIAFLLNLVGVLEGQLATAQAELEALEPIAAPQRRSPADRERYRKHAAWQSFEHYLKQAEAAARKWQKEADWLRGLRDTRKAESEAGTWPPCEGCDEHPARALGLDGGDPDGR